MYFWGGNDHNECLVNAKDNGNALFSPTNADSVLKSAISDRVRPAHFVLNYGTTLLVTEPILKS